MDKDYMIKEVKYRIKTLENIYKGYVNNVSPSGKQCSKGGAAVSRCKVKKEICTLKLVLELLESSSIIELVDEDAILGFEKLVKE